jgi:hypothetical protein
MSTHDATPADSAFSPDGEYDDWDDAPITPRVRAPWLTKLLGIAVVAALAFAGGVVSQKHWGSSTAASGTGSGASAAARRFGGGFGRFGGASAGTGGATGSTGLGTSGQVSYIKGTTLYVADLSGGTVKVSTTGARVTKTERLTAGAIHPGDTVVVQGATKKDGTIAATSVTVGGGLTAILGGG